MLKEAVTIGTLVLATLACGNSQQQSNQSMQMVSSHNVGEPFKQENQLTEDIIGTLWEGMLPTLGANVYVKWNMVKQYENGKVVMDAKSLVIEDYDFLVSSTLYDMDNDYIIDAGKTHPLASPEMATVYKKEDLIVLSKLYVEVLKEISDYVKENKEPPVPKKPLPKTQDKQYERNILEA